MEHNIPLSRLSSNESYYSTRNSLTSSTQRIQNPAAPHPESSALVIQIFLRDFFLANDISLSQAQAEERASKLKVNGDSLYRLTREGLSKVFDAQGEALYDIIQYGPWGYEGSYWVHLRIFAVILYIVAGGFAGWQFKKDAKSRTFIIPYIAIGLLAAIILLHKICATDRVIKARLWPEKLKIRNRVAAGAAKWTPIGACIEQRGPNAVFCLAIPRRRKLAIPDLLFDIALNEITSHFRTPWITLSAAILVTIDTISWLMTIFALSGPILLSVVYEASIDAQILAFLQEKIRNKLLSTIQRSRLLYTVLVGNLDMLNVPFGDQIDNTALCHIDGLLKKLQVREIEYKYHHIGMNGSIDKGTNTRQDLLKAKGKAVQKTKTRLRAMLAAQYSFGVTVGAPVIFFCGSFIYTLVDNYSKLGDNNTSHALAFGMWWMIVLHIAIVSGLLLAGNNPNTLEGVVGQPTAKPQVPHRRFFELVYESRYIPTWIWQRGRSKKIWIERIGYDKASAPEGLEAKLRMNLSSWMVVGFLAYSLILIPSVLAFLTAFYTPTVGLSCRSMTFLLYMLCQLHLTVLWMWDIHSTYLDEHGVPHTPVTRIPWLRGGFRRNWEACVWWPLVIIGSAGAIFSAMGGTMMQIMGVYRNCLCQLSIRDWRPLAYDATFVISTNSAEAIEAAATWWKGTGASAVGYLAFISYVGWWYQRRLRHQFKLLVNSIDESAEDL